MNFLGKVVKFPVPTADVARDVALAKNGDSILHYDHFSVQMNARRRMPIWTVRYITGRRTPFLTTTVPAGPMIRAWMRGFSRTTGSSLRERAGPEPSTAATWCASSIPVWGEPSVAERAQEHTFCLTNVCPQEHGFNDREWGDLEDHILSTTKAAAERCVVFTGPIFLFDDPLIADLLKGGPREDIPMPEIQSPGRFFKIVAWRNDRQGPLKAAGFVRDQADEMARKPFFERMVIGGVKQEQRAIADIQTMTGLEFPNLAQVDTIAASGRRAVTLSRAVDAVI